MVSLRAGRRQPKRLALFCRRKGKASEYRVSSSNTFRMRPNHPVDAWLLFVVVTLAMIGLIVVYAATYHLGINYLKWQFIRAGVGLLALFVGMKLRYPALAGWLGRSLVGLVLLLLILTVVWGRAVGDARRWVGFLQPAEIAKFVLPMWLAAYFAELKGRLDKEWNFRNSVIKPGAVVLMFLFLTGAQPAIGTTAIMAVSSLFLFFIVGVKFRYLVPIGIVAMIGLVLLVQFVPYANKRWHDFSQGKCYHQKQSLISIGSGGPFGKGLGEGKQKFYFLPKLHTDFAIAAIGEEFGFAGSLAIFLLYGVFLVRGMQIGRKVNTYFGQYLTSGIVITIFMYAFVHIGVALGLLPTTGQPLPFVSYGGSALVTNLFAAGVILKISTFNRRPDENRNGRGRYRRPYISRTRAGR